jgi:hypothetical protein
MWCSRLLRMNAIVLENCAAATAPLQPVAGINADSAPLEHMGVCTDGRYCGGVAPCSCLASYPALRSSALGCEQNN